MDNEEGKRLTGAYSRIINKRAGFIPWLPSKNLLGYMVNIENKNIAIRATTIVDVAILKLYEIS